MPLTIIEDQDRFRHVKAALSPCLALSWKPEPCMKELVREAGKRGLHGAVVRPGYILGSRHSGVSNTDDFLIRLCKGCVQLGARPCIINSINACPVDHVAHVVVGSVSRGCFKD
jgi:thioester reductase-like protein